MRRFLSFMTKVTLLTLLFTGMFSLNTILPYSTKVVAEAQEPTEAIAPPPSQEPVEVVVPSEPPTQEATPQEPEETLPEIEAPVSSEKPAPEPQEKPKKIAYLTFDDGPSPRVTPRILDTLKAYDIQATFFVIGNLAEQYPQLIKRAQEEGHFISNHTYSHQYKKIYAHPDRLLEEFAHTDQVLRNILGDGYTSKVVRFPGGSFGEKRKPFREAVAAAGYYNIDWNVLSGDAEAKLVSVEKQLARIKETLPGKDRAVILMHDANGKTTTADALPQIIEYLISQGYTFDTLEHYDF